MALVSLEPVRPHVTVVTLDNPSRLNSLSFALVEDLYTALSTVAADNDCRVVVLTGAGRAFCSGLELEHAGLPPGTGGMGFHRMAMRSMEFMGGIVPAMRAIPQPIWLLPRAVGTSHASEIMLTGKKVDATEALRIGLVSRVTADDAVVDEAVSMAEGMCAFSPFGLALTKQTLWASHEVGSLGAAVDLENRTQLLAGHTGNLTEATSAFKEKRPAVYTE